MSKVAEYYTKIKEKILSIYTKTLAQFISTLFAHQVSILFLGIDNAGKTTLLNLLRDQQTTTRPTNHPTSSEIEVCKMKANIIDLGGHEAARVVWDSFFYQCDGVVFIIDAVDRKRFSEVKNAFETVKTSIPKQGKPIPISVLVNKMDIVWEMNNGDAQEVEKYCQMLLSETGIEDGELVKVSFVTMMVGEDRKQDQGIYDSFKWLKDRIFPEKK